MSTPFLGEIKIFSFNFPPKGWAFCNGAVLPINQNQALFSILGTTYGGNGINTFALPNLQGRIPVHFGDGIILGQSGGETAHTLTVAEMPAHPHAPVGSSNSAVTAGPAGSLWATQTSGAYAPATDTAMSPGGIQAAGGGQPHENMPPYLVLNYCIALSGIFPSHQ